jgi:hypothetical protein
MGFVFFILVFIVILPLKAILNRDRPKKIEHVKRYFNLRDLENNNKSMPSGDAAVCAFFLGFYYIYFQ